MRRHRTHRHTSFTAGVAYREAMAGVNSWRTAKRNRYRVSDLQLSAKARSLKATFCVGNAFKGKRLCKLGRP